MVTDLKKGGIEFGCSHFSYIETFVAMFLIGEGRKYLISLSSFFFFMTIMSSSHPTQTISPFQKRVLFSGGYALPSGSPRSL